MNTYLFEEVGGALKRKAVAVHATDLAAAKLLASENRRSEKSLLLIEDESGYLLCYRQGLANWVEVHEGGGQ